MIVLHYIVIKDYAFCDRDIISAQNSNLTAGSRGGQQVEHERWAYEECRALCNSFLGRAKMGALKKRRVAH